MDAKQIAADLESEYMAVANGDKKPAKIALEPMVRAVEELRRLAALPSDAAQAPKKPYGYVLSGNYWTDDELTAKQVSVRTGSNYLPIYAAPVAPAAAAPINLEGLRKKLLTPRKILRDENGWLSHPDYPICDEGTNADAFLSAFGIETWFRSMESDAPDFSERYHEEGLSNCTEWTPTPPTGEGWLLLAIYDTEDGPCAMFGRDQHEAENALKRQRMRELSARIQQRQADKGAAQ